MPGTTHLVLAHRVLSDPRYAAYYRLRQRCGDYIILDNSAFELGESISDKKLLQAADLIRPHEVVLPDVLGESESTIRRVKSFLDAYGHRLIDRLRFMAVPHGQDMQEYLACYQALCAMPQVYSLGIGAIYNHRMKHDMFFGRELIIYTLASNGLLSAKPHHLLGLGDSGHIELQRLRAYRQVRSCDSSAAYIQAKNGVNIAKDRPYRKVPEKINFEDDFSLATLDRLTRNMRLLSEVSYE